jgi:hypothetical protein
MSLKDLSAYGRSQISEHIDRKVWLVLHDVDASWAIVELARAHRGWRRAGITWSDT